MIVVCREIYNLNTKRYVNENNTAFLTVNKIYVVLEMDFYHDGIFVRIVPDCKGHPVLVRIEDFEIISGIIPSSWRYKRITSNCVTLSPKDWIDINNWEEDFWDDWENWSDKARESYNKELSLIREQEKEILDKNNLIILDDGEIVSKD